LQVESSRRLHQAGLSQYFQESSPHRNINNEWETSKQVIKQSAIEIFGKRKKHYRGRDLKVWNEKIARIIEETKTKSKKLYLCLTN
jgi:hypothetical protein